MIGGLTFYGVFFFWEKKERKKRAFVATRMVIMMEVGVRTDESHPKSRLIILSLLGVSVGGRSHLSDSPQKSGCGSFEWFWVNVGPCYEQQRERKRRKKQTTTLSPNKNILLRSAARPLRKKISTRANKKELEREERGRNDIVLSAQIQIWSRSFFLLLLLLVVCV